MKNKNIKNFSKHNIILKKEKTVYLENSNYYIEDIRKLIVDKYGFDKSL